MEQIQMLYERYKNNVYRLALSYTGQPQDAEDVTQTVFVKLIRHMGRLQPGKEQSWLLTVTANECRNLLRQRSLMSQEALPELPAEIPEETSLFDALLQLQPQYRAVVHLFYFEGYTTREIGKLLGVKRSGASAAIPWGGQGWRLPWQPC